MAWRTFKGREIHQPITDLVGETILREKQKGYRLRVCVGTDSQVRNSLIRFATAIVFLRENSGGFMYIKHQNMHTGMSLRERMIQEVAQSVQVAYNINPVLVREGIKLEVHADINSDPSYPSHPALQEARGYIQSMGYAFKAKPEAFASSACADRAI